MDRIPKGCIIYDFTEELERLSKLGTLQGTIERIKRVNIMMAEPDSPFDADGKFTFIEIPDNGKTKYGLIFWDLKDRKLRRKTMKDVKQWIWNFVKGAGSSRRNGKVVDMKTAWDLPIPYRIISGLDQFEDPGLQVQKVAEALIKDRIADDPNSVNEELESQRATEYEEE